jgi:hypothetical protein
MYARVVRFTDVNAERIEQVLAQIEESGGPPPGVSVSRLQVLTDADQGTAVVVQYFDSAEDMAEGAQVLEAMDSSETPGTRVAVDTCEVRLDIARS